MTTNDRLWLCLTLARAAKKEGLIEERRHYTERAWKHRAALRNRHK